jgi:hypothetical protein
VSEQGVETEDEVSAPIAYLVAERREGAWLLGDDWIQRCDTLADAQEVAEKWRAAKWYSSDPADVAVFAIVMAEPVPSAVGTPRRGAGRGRSGRGDPQSRAP